MYKVTIAIPVYNTQNFISSSLLSALNQTFKSIEFLIIDDKGDDNSMGIVHELIKNSNRIKDIRVIVHKKNIGIANVRNTALKEATGEYLFFLDSDDTITENCIEFLYNKITKHPVDFVAASFQKVSEDEQILESYTYPEIIINKKNEIAEYQYRNIRRESIAISVWNKLYKLSFLRNNKISFIPERSYEDTTFSFNLILKAQSCILTSEILYNYKIRQNSISQFNSRKIIPIKEVEEHLLYKTYYKEESSKYKSYPFYENMISQIMICCFYSVTSIIKKRKMFSERISSKIFNCYLTYPVSFCEVCKFKHYKVLNLSLFFFSKLPYCIKLPLIILYLKLKHSYKK